MRRQSIACQVAGTLAMGWASLIAPAAVAAPWIAQPTVSLSADYQSNPLYNTVDARPGRSESIRLSVPVSTESGRNRVFMTANAQAYDSHGASSGNTFGYQVDGLWSRGGERTSVSLSANSSRTSLIGSTSVDIGNNRAGGYQNGQGAALAGSWSPDERGNLEGYLRFTRDHFDAPLNPELVDGRFATAGATYSHVMNPQARWSLSASAGRSEAEDNSRRSSNFGMQLGMAYQFSELWRLQAALGRSTVRNSLDGAESSGATYSFSLARTMALGSIAINASRGLQASAYGTSALVDTAALTHALRLSDRLNLSADLSWNRSRDTNIGFNIQSREFRQASIAVSRSMTAEWTLSLTGRYTQSDSIQGMSSLRSVASSMAGTLSVGRRFNPVGL